MYNQQNASQNFHFFWAFRVPAMAGSELGCCFNMSLRGTKQSREKIA
ncbi:MAG: hypothetical protein RLZZ312_767 [Bacteroidota bacterium]|jgi:hypothetical protein